MNSPAKEPPANYPNPVPRPPGELEELERIWKPPRGIGLLGAVNNTYIGLYYTGTAVWFFLLAGILALLMRTQLAVPENDFLGEETYNQIFTMHGTVMMFLFAVPVVEAMAVYLLPNMQSARDLPFPRLSAYAFWAYFVGGNVFFMSLFFKVAPAGGWFMYPPLTSTEFSPGINADFWLLGIGFIEISAIAGAVEIVVGVLKTRAPGMTLARLPVYSWAMLVFAGMIIFAFPAVILCTLLLELERAFGWPFFIAEKGGDPLLWQHLFWFFGHPEVYIIFIPAAGFVSMIVPAMAQTPLVAYRLVVLALLGTGFLSFGLWVHHMFATGLPQISMSFFSAASMAVAVPSGIQVFAWIATLAAATGRVQMKTPTLFVLGFLFIFTLGGLTGVMVAMAPYDWQVHDTYFVVAHFHYVLIGGMVFPLFAAFYYWAPMASKNALSEHVGRWVFALLFIGINVAFFPMHLTGLIGMPRRVWTYPAGLGWDTLNMVSTVGAFIAAAGVLLFVIDMAKRFRPSFADNAGNPWNAGTLEWLPTDTYNTRSMPRVWAHQPLWDNPKLSDEVEAGRWYLPGAPTGGREALVTSPVEGEPQYILQIPGEPSWSPFIGAVFTAAFFLLLTVKLVAIALICAVIAVAAVLVWMWDTDPGPTRPPADIGGGIVVPVYMTGPSSHSWWGTVVLLLVGASLFACLVFAYFYLWTVNTAGWPPEDIEPAGFAWNFAAAIGYVLGSGLIYLAGRALPAAHGGGAWTLRLLLAAAVVVVVAAFGAHFYGYWVSGLRAPDSGYGAVVYSFIALQGQYVFTLLIMGLFVIARSFAGKLDAVRRQTYDNTMLMWHYTTAQGLISLAVVALFPSLLG